MKRYELRIDLEDFNGTSRYAKYSEFKVASEPLKYKLLSLGTYSGTAGIVHCSEHDVSGVSYTVFCKPRETKSKLVQNFCFWRI